MEKKLFHTVFFQLKESSEKKVAEFVEDCKTYLSSHPGLLSIHVGRRAEEHERDVNMTDYHVSIHLIFGDKKSHDQYQTAEKHNEFVEKNRDNWAEVKVYDSWAV